MNWETINFNAQQIEYETGKATLIKMPNKSKYAGYKFWHPSKLVRSTGGKGYHMSFSFTDQFEFVLKKYGNGQYNRNEVINEIKLTPQQMLEAFGLVDEAIEQANLSHEIKLNDSYLVVQEPALIEVEGVVRDELIND